MKILNLGCGNKTSDRPEVINIDWSIYLRLKMSAIWKPIIPLFVRGERARKLAKIPKNVLLYNLAKGIPFDTSSVDVVYHSHMFEHLDRDDAERFLLEVKRVLKPGGIQRIVVPDFERVCREYLAHIEISERDKNEASIHDEYVATVIEQSVRKEAFASRQQGRLRKMIENFLLGDARGRGETHQWMYDRISIESKLFHAGYVEVKIQEFDTSDIPDWTSYGLDVDSQGGQYKPGSLYVEARK